MEATAIEAALAQAIQDLGLDPGAAKKEITALAKRLCGGGTDSDEDEVDFETIEELMRKLPNHMQTDNGTLVFVGTTCVDGKWYRTEKWWATVDGQVVWEHPEAKKLREWRGASIMEMGYDFCAGAEKIYLAVYLVPPGKKIRFVGIWEDKYKGRRPLRGYKVTS